MLQDTNRRVEAAPLMKLALAINEQSFGPEHPNVALGLNNLAHLLQDTNRHAEALPLMRRALKIMEHSYSSDHPNAKTMAENLATCVAELEAKGKR